MIRKTLMFIILFCGISLSAQEICINGIDDDGDGLIDLNDTEDCNCPSSIPSGLIPNPSFEDRTCCPQSGQQLNCAVSWIQASAATSDYFHTCGITGPWWVNKTAPQPLPDGEGYVGFRDGRANNGQFKEYVGSVLNETMEVGKEYRLDFFLGFAPEIEQTIDMTVYATTEASNLPFGGNSENIGCPTNVAGWDKLDNQIVTGQGIWRNIIFDLNADKPYNVIVIGPGCEVQNNLFNEWYFFVDRLALAETVDFGVPFAEIQGSLCENNLTIVAESSDEYGYQWFKDGVAIIGETNIDLNLDVIDSNEGLYQVLISTPEGCFTSEEYDLYVPTLVTNITATGCEGDPYIVGDQEFFDAGFYTVPLTSSIGCDSFVNLTLNILIAYEEVRFIPFCEGDTYTLGDSNYTEPGVYSQTFIDVNGCDSVVVANLYQAYSNIDIEVPICPGGFFIQDNDVLTVPDTYTYTYSSADGCDSIINITIVEAPVYDFTIPENICEGDTYILGDIPITTAGDYDAVLTSIYGCDSIITVQLTVSPATSSSISGAICAGEGYPILDTIFTEAGLYELITTNSNGCDSIITLDLINIEYENDLTLPPDLTVDLGSNLSISPSFINPQLNQVVWTDDLGQVLSNESILELTSIIGPIDVTVLGVDQYGCTDSDSIQIRVDRNIIITTPNIFSPNDDGINDFFKPVVNGSINVLKEMNIYDRWGSLVHTTENIIDLQSWQGWNGKTKGVTAMTGVYVYSATFVALDGGEELISGDVTVVR